MRASDGKILIDASAIPIVAIPPATTVVTAPKIAATAPDSNAPSSFDAEMKTISTAPTRPRSSFGVTSATVVERMFTLNMSTKPATASATSVSGSHAEAPQTTCIAPKRTTTTISVGPAARRSGRRATSKRGGERTHRGRGAQHAEPRRPDVEDVAGEDRQQGDPTAEEDGEEIERDRAEQHLRAPDEADAADEAGDSDCRLLARGPWRDAERSHRHTGDREQHGRHGVDGFRSPREEQPADRRSRDHRDRARHGP